MTEVKEQEMKLINPALDRVSVPVNFLPQFRTTIALQRKVEKNLLFRTWGGLGDQICAEPTIRYALKMFKGCEISLASEHPKLFSHLQFKKQFDLNEVTPNYDKYLTLETIVPPDDSNLVWQFFGHMITHCVDFASMCALRCQLPVADKEIQLSPPKPNDARIVELAGSQKHVVVHAGKHWPSKTFPKDWWDSVLRGLIEAGITPVLIGANTDDNRGTVDVNVEGCIDLRNQTSIQDSIWLCQRARVLLTNDSSPLHMAASHDPNDETSGKTWIGFVATCKHPDYIQHWRKGQWAWRQKNFGRGGIWDHVNYCPNKESDIEIDKVEEAMLRSWLPEPVEMSEWAIEKVRQDA